MMLGLFPGPLRLPDQSSKIGQRFKAVTTSGLRNVDLIAIGYGCRPRLRGRLTLRGLALRRNPWTSGDRVSHPVDRYSCQHAHFRYLQRSSRTAFTGLRNAPLPGQKADGRRQTQRSSRRLQRLAQALQHLARSPCTPRATSPRGFVDVAQIETIAAPQTRISSADPMAITTKRRKSAGCEAAAGQSLRPDWRRSTCSPAAPDRPAPAARSRGNSRLVRWTARDSSYARLKTSDPRTRSPAGPCLSSAICHLSFRTPQLRCMA